MEHLAYQRTYKCPFCKDLGRRLIPYETYIKYVPEYEAYCKKIYGDNVPPGIEIGVVCDKCSNDFNRSGGEE